MNWNEIEGNWESMKGQAKQTWGKLTDDDWMVIKGKKQQLMGTLQKRYGYSVEQAEKEIEKFASNCNCSDSSKKSMSQTCNN